MSVIILKDDMGIYYVCEEYNEADAGRCHIVGENAYANFDKGTMSLDRQKVSITICSIIFEDVSWPEGTVRTRHDILARFDLS
jgi:hypothetical protein